LRKINIAILTSNTAGNLQSIIEHVEKGTLNVNISVIISGNYNSPGLKIAREHDVDSICIPYKGNREGHEKEILSCLKEHAVDLVILDGYMRIFSPSFVRTYKNRIMNVHPSLLPSFSGRNAWEQALDHGVKVSGCTIHFADEGIDTGPIILQAPVQVMEDDTVETLKERILVEEKRLYPEAIRLFAEGRLKVEGRKVKIKH